MSFTNTVFNIMVLCTTSVLQFLLVPQKKQESKNICSRASIIGTNWDQGSSVNQTVWIIKDA
jgi:hypothetical protein